MQDQTQVVVVDIGSWTIDVMPIIDQFEILAEAYLNAVARKKAQ